jgi:hypothetical protein
MNKHEREAKELNLAGLADNAHDGGSRGIIVGLDALRHATLALVEQQRIGNRIALAKVVAETERFYQQNGCRAHLVGHEAALYDNDIDTPPLRADIREGLDL